VFHAVTFVTAEIANVKQGIDDSGFSYAVVFDKVVSIAFIGCTTRQGRVAFPAVDVFAHTTIVSEASVFDDVFRGEIDRSH
jgi:hypothetical protein